MSRCERCWGRPVAVRRVLSPFAGLWRVRSTRSTPRIPGLHDPRRRRPGCALGRVTVTDTVVVVVGVTDMGAVHR